MDRIIDLDILKRENYMPLTNDLNELLFAYWNLLKFESNDISKNEISLIYEIINILNLRDEIKKVSLENDDTYIGGYYNFEEKELILNIQGILQLKKMKIISNCTFVIECLTILFHEIFHAIQHKYMNNYDDYLISTFKRLSINIKQNKILNNQLHDLIPDEREASIESAKLIYNFAQKNFLLSQKELAEVDKNLNFYLTNGYLYRGKISVYPYQSILKCDCTIPKLIYEKLEIYYKVMYGLNIQNDQMFPSLVMEDNKRLLKL